MPEYRQNSIATRVRNHSASIGQRIFASSLGLVVVALSLTSIAALVVTTRTTRETVEEQSREINKQIVFNYDRYIASVLETANYVTTAVGRADVALDREALTEVFELNAEIKGDVVSIVLFDSGAEAVIGTPVRRRPAASPLPAWFIAARGQPEIFHFAVGPSASRALAPDEAVITVARAIEYRTAGRMRDGVLLVELNTEAITALAERTNLGAGGHILILDERGGVVYASASSRYVEQSISLAQELYLGGVMARLDSVDMYVHTNTIANTRWRIVTVSNVGRLGAARSQVIAIVVLIALGSLLFAAFVAGVISVRLSSPLNQLRSAMAAIEGGDLDTDIRVTGQREIVELAHSFSSMVERVRALMQRLVDEQRAKRRTELKALQHQINPHFLYNTLDSIVWLAEHDRSDAVVDTVVALASFFRISISKGETFIPLREELEHVRSYLTIQQIRYVERFTYAIDVDPSLLDHTVMKLVLQPLVENAIYHGMGDETGHIAIHGYRRGESLALEVTNTGYGLSDERIRHMRERILGAGETGSVGLRNVYQRLVLTYGPSADIEVESEPDELTVVRIVIPATVPAEEMTT